MRSRASVQRLVRALAWGVFACALLAYGSALAGDYVFDDQHSIRGNDALHDLSNLGRYWVDPSAFSSAGRMYRPALLTTFACNWAICPAAWSLKAGNVLLHAAVAVTMFLWLWRLSRRAVVSACVAAGFAVHPLASEAINLVSARSELLVTLGLLLALHAQLSWQRRGGSVGLLFAMVLATVLACGSKETGVMVPVLCAVQAVVLRHGAFDRRACGRALWAIAPMVLVVIAYLVVRKLLLGDATVQLLGRTGEDPTSGHGRTLLMHWATMASLLPQVLLQALAPLRLSMDPAVQYRDSFADPMVLAGAAMLLGLTLWAWRRGPTARLRRLGVAFAWCVALPWIVIPLNMPLAEHRLYGPLVGFAAIVVAAMPRTRRWQQGTARVVLRGLTAALLVTGIALSTQRSLLYRDESELWRVELVHNTTSFRSWWGLGTSMLRMGDVQGSLGPLAQAHTLNTRHFDTLRNYTEALLSLPDEAAQPERALQVAAELNDLAKFDPWARTLHANAHLQAGRVSGLREHFAAAERLALSCLQIATAKGYVYRLAAQARRGLGDLPGALAHLDTSIASGLAPVGVRLDRAALLRELGRHREAKRELLLAQRDAPTDAQVMRALMQSASPPR